MFKNELKIIMNKSCGYKYVYEYLQPYYIFGFIYITF